MDEKQIRKWVEERMRSFVRQMRAVTETGAPKFTVKELANYLHALANEAELRLSNPNFPEANEE